MENKTFCILPWISIGMNPHGTVRACGKSKINHTTSLKNNTIENAWNSEYFTTLREDMLAGNKNPNCQKCFVQEDLGCASKRLKENKHHNFDIDQITRSTVGGKITTLPKIIDLRVGNICNLKCVHCWTGNSSKWYEDSLLLNKYENLSSNPIDNNWISNQGNVWEYIKENIKSIDTLNVLGGEPFASKEFHQLIDWLVVNKHDVQLKVVSNGTLLNQQLIDKLEYFSSVIIGISLDDINTRAEFLRFPTQWEEFTANMKYLSKSKLRKYFNWTAYNLNIWNLPATIKYAQQFDISFELADFVQFPNHMSIQNLPSGFKEEVSNKLAHIEGIDFYLKYMNNNDLWEEHKDTLYNYLEDLTIARSVNWKPIFPEIINLYDR